MRDLVVLTGHSSGLGLALLNAFLERDTFVIGIARRQTLLRDVNLYEFACDLSESIDVLLKDLKIFIENQLPQIRSLTFVNNAGSVHPTALIGALDAEQIAASMQLNLTTPMQILNLLHKFTPKLSFRFIQISSGAAQTPYPGWLVYCASKAAMKMSAQILANEAGLTSADIRVIIYEPGVLDTPMQNELRKIGKDRFPKVERFQMMFDNNKLIEPTDSAHYLIKLWGDSNLPSFIETRYGTVGRV